MTVMIKTHTVKIKWRYYYPGRLYWASCECGWRSDSYNMRKFPEQASKAHIAAVGSGIQEGQK